MQNIYSRLITRLVMFTLQFCNIASEKCLRFKKAVATRVCVARSGGGVVRAGKEVQV